MLAQLVEDLLHLEGRRDGLDQRGGPDGADRDAERLLRGEEDVVPQPGLEMALHLGQVEVRAGPLLQQFFRIVEEMQAEIDQSADRRSVLERDVPFVQVPAPGPHHDRREGRVVAQAVLAAVRAGERRGPPDGVVEVHLAAHDVGPVRRVGVLQIGQPDLGAGVQRVDHHLALGRPGDLDPTVDQVSRGGRDLPTARTDFGGLGQEVQPSGAGHLGASRDPQLEQLVAPARVPLVEQPDEGQRLAGQDQVRTLDRGSGHLERHHEALPSAQRPGRLCPPAFRPARLRPRVRRLSPVREHEQPRPADNK